MQYLQADTTRNTLRVLPSLRDFSDFRHEKHYDYHVATFQLFEGSRVNIVIEADNVPFAALLHMRLFVRIVSYLKSRKKSIEIESVVLEDASFAASTILRLLTPIIPASSSKKILHRSRGSVLVKKTE